MPKQIDKLRVGEVRPSQVVHTFGVGSLVDLPNISAVVMGLGEWEAPTPLTEISEERLLALVRSHLGEQVERLVRPPTPSRTGVGQDPFDPELLKGIPVAPFPRWVRCPLCDLIAPLDFGVFSLKKDLWRLDKNRFVHTNCQKSKGAPPAVIPVRFIVVCEHGHMSDFPWVEFVHKGPTKCAALLRLREFGVSAEAADIVVQCDTCNASRPMSNAFYGDQAEDGLGKCPGHHPHLRFRIDTCEEPPKAMLSGATNLWFPVTVSALSVPTEKGVLKLLVKENWPQLKNVTNQDVLAAFKATGYLSAFAEWSDDELWSTIEEVREGGDEEQPQKLEELRRTEWEVFCAADPSLNSKDFQLTSVDPPPGYEGLVSQVVQAERLRVVKALTGFTRIVSPGDYADPAEIPDIRRVSLARSRPTWVPASEVRGEGLFLRFNEEAIASWLGSEAAKHRSAEFRKAHTAFRKMRKIEKPEANFPGLRYVLLHSLSHALIRQFAIECGYGAASLQERIYASDGGDDGGPMAGILLYTAAPDSEGTLGGLVSLGELKVLARHLDQALEDMRLCASDPLCSEHSPTEEGITLHGAACHACLFSSETSCERGNKYLDRTLLVETIGGEPLPFFEEPPRSG